MPKIVILLLILQSLLVCQQGFAEELNSTKYIFWDSGQLPGLVDETDMIFDYTKSCEESGALLSVKNAKTIFSIQQEINSLASVKKVLEKFGLPFFKMSENVKGDQHLYVPRHHYNPEKDTIYVLLPEAHLGASLELIKGNKQLLERFLLINVKRALLGTLWIEDGLAPSDKILNLNEGPKARSFLFTDWTPSGNKYSDVVDIAGHSVFSSLGNIYQGENRLINSGTEEPLSIALDALTGATDYVPGMAFENVLASYIIQASSSEVALLKLAYDHVKDLSLDQLEKITEDLCEKRSIAMGEEAIRLTENKKPKLVFLTFGMAHTHGVVQVLERENVNFIILMSNAKTF